MLKASSSQQRIRLVEWLLLNLSLKNRLLSCTESPILDRQTDFFLSASTIQPVLILAHLVWLSVLTYLIQDEPW